jgi:hypothetical protein
MSGTHAFTILKIIEIAEANFAFTEAGTKTWTGKVTYPYLHKLLKSLS